MQLTDHRIHRNKFLGARSKMTIQRITHLHSAPISACLRAFVLAAETGISMNSRPLPRLLTSITDGNNKLGMNPSSMAYACKGGNAKSTQGNSALLRGSA